jgi:transcription initiation factor IIE alpha subunit
MNQINLKTPHSIIKLLKIIVRAFYSDLHIITIDILLKLGYVSEFSLSKELKIETEKIRMITNSLQKENFLRNKNV